MRRMRHASSASECAALIKIKRKLCRILLLKFESELSFLVQQAPSRLELFSLFS